MASTDRRWNIEQESERGMLTYWSKNEEKTCRIVKRVYWPVEKLLQTLLSAVWSSWQISKCKMTFLTRFRHLNKYKIRRITLWMTFCTVTEFLVPWMGLTYSIMSLKLILVIETQNTHSKLVYWSYISASSSTEVQFWTEWLRLCN